MPESLKIKTIKGVAWSGLEKTLTYVVTFIVGIVMARLLTPDDYGIVGIITVFVSFSQLFIDGGFTTALIAKANRNETDFQTVFVFNLVASFLLYGFLFLFAPRIELFYGIEKLGTILRVQCLNLVIASLSSIQITKFTIAADFKTISKISVPSSILSGIAGIAMAYLGMGVWALVYQGLLNAGLRVLLSIYHSRWMPRFHFSKESFKQLFSFSYKLLTANIIDKVYSNAYPLFIGKFFPPATLGNYSRGEHFGRIPASILTDVFSRVTFPIMSNIQNDTESLRIVFRKYIRFSSLVVFPIYMLLFICAEPIVRILLTEKWLECVVFIRFITMSVMFSHICNINLNLLYVKQHSDWALKLEFIKKGVAISLFLVSTYWGIIGVCVAQLIYGMIAPSLNAFYTKRIIGLSYLQQLKDYGPLFLGSVALGIVAMKLESLICSPWLQILFGSGFYVLLYVILNWVINRSDMKQIVEESRNLVNHRL